MPRVVALVPNLGPSAPAAVASLLAAHLPPDRFAVTISAGNQFVTGWWKQWAPLRDFAPDVIHAFGPVAVRAARLALLPGIGLRGRPKLVASFADRTVSRLDHGLTRWSLSAVDRVVAASALEADRLAALGVPADRVRFIPPGVPAAPPAPDPIAFRRALDIPDAARLIIAAGGFDATAGLRSAVWAFDVVKYVAPDLYLVLAGGGPDRERVDRFGRAIGFDDYRIRFAGVRADLSAVLRLADVVWVVHERGGVQITLEAMAAGRPIVAVATPDLAAIVADGVTGQLVGRRDRVRLAAVTHKLLEHPADAARLGVAAQSAVAERFPLEGMVTRYAQVYDEVARGPAP